MAYISTSLKKTFDIEKIVTIHFFEYPPDFVFLGESHNFWEVAFVDSGAAEIYADEKYHLLERGEAIFHKPMEFHTLRSAKGTAPSLFIFSFVCNSPAMGLFENSVVKLSDAEKNMLSTIKVEAEKCFSTPINLPTIERVLLDENALIGSEQVIQNMLELFLVSIARKENSTATKSANHSSHSVYSTGKNSLFIKQVLTYFLDHLQDHLSIKQIAEDNLIGRSRLQEIFHDEFDCGAMQIFSEMKINKAKELIRGKTLSLKEISDALGYNDFSYFSKHFKKIVGYSPSSYANSIQSISTTNSSGTPIKWHLLFYEELK